ncbi:FAD-dependent oxidoreductase [bacterium]|nr:FAD-dependent oxidoreductase [bacterium]
MLYDLIIIGGGPAGITAAIYASRKKLKTLLLTKHFRGQASKAKRIVNYPGFESISGPLLMKKFKNHLENFDVEIKEGKKVKKIKKLKGSFKVMANADEEYQGRAVIIASGRDPRPLEVPGEKEVIGHGVSYCPICDAPFFQDKTVAIIGGGNAGFEAALDLSKYAKKIYILEISSKVIADEITQEQVKKTGKVEVILNAKVKEILSKKENHALWCKGLIYKDLSSKKEKELKTDGVFIMIGEIPATDFARGLVEFNEKDEIVVDLKTCQTKTRGLFACGDVTNILYHQIVIAAGEGAKAALSAYNYLKETSEPL